MKENRTREWIHKPVLRGIPASFTREYFRGKLQKFRKKHKEFDAFLIDIYAHLNKEKDSDYKNLCLFIEGKSETNWISPNGGLFDIFIKLFNLCLSPEQAFEYIKECHKWYLFMSNVRYEIFDEPVFSIRRSSWDGKSTKFVDVNILPKEEPENRDYYYWFHISTSLKVVEDDLNDISCHVDKINLVCAHEKLHDVLMLFVNHQNKAFFRNIFNTTLNKLTNSGFIREIKTEQFYDWIIHYYDTDTENISL